MVLSIITLGEKVEAVLGNHPFNEKEADEDSFFLIVTDDAAMYQNSIKRVGLTPSHYSDN